MTAHEPAVTLLIVNYNTRDLLAQCLDSIAVHCPAAEVVVVDNASRDESAAMVHERYPSVKLVEAMRNDGFAAANNAGLEVATGEYIVLLNSDTVLEDDGLSRLASYMAAHLEIGAASPEIVGMDGNVQTCFYPFPSLWETLRIAMRRPPRAVAGDRDPDAWLAGTALMLRRSALEAVGGRLDDTYFMYWEDADLSARLRRGGWVLAYYPDAHIRHYGGASGGGSDANRRSDLSAWAVWGKHRWFARNRPAWETPCLWLLDWVEVARKLVRGAVRPAYRYEWSQAGVMARVLALRLAGQTPPRPGRGPVKSAVDSVSK